MTGEGELWVRPDGLPMRQIVTTHFPQANDTRTDATITVDFSDYPLAPAAPLAPNASVLAFSTTGVEQAFSSFAAAFPTMVANLLMLALGCGMVLMIVRLRHSRLTYTLLALYVILAMEASPLLQPPRPTRLLPCSIHSASSRSNSRPPTNGTRSARHSPQRSSARR